jgi:hypothetical protein
VTIRSPDKLLKEVNMAQPRPRKQISSKLEKTLVAYISAGAAATFVAPSELAEAKIIYSNTNIRVGFRPIEIDLNHDGIPDFVITGCPAYHSQRSIVGPRVTGNAIQGVPGSEGAAAGFRGTPNGPGDLFGVSSEFCSSENGVVPVGIGMETYLNYLSAHSFFGPWLNKTNRYLGLKFVIKGKDFYGWDRLSVHGLQLTSAAMPTKPGPIRRSLKGRRLILPRLMGRNRRRQPGLLPRVWACWRAVLTHS